VRRPTPTFLAVLVLERSGGSGRTAELVRSLREVAEAPVDDWLTREEALRSTESAARALSSCGDRVQDAIGELRVAHYRSVVATTRGVDDLSTQRLDDPDVLSDTNHVRFAVYQYRSAVGGAVSKLQAVRPPAGLRRAHHRYLAALRGLSAAANRIHRRTFAAQSDLRSQVAALRRRASATTSSYRRLVHP
jgi:hypothetical protein